MRNPLFNWKRPAGLDQYIIDHEDVNYCIGDSSEAYCTATNGKCRHLDEFVIEHGMQRECRDCGHTVIMLRKHFGRKKREEFGRILWFRKQGRATYAQLDEYIISYERIVPQVFVWASAQYKLTKEEQLYYKHIPEGWYREERWEQRKEINVPAPWSLGNWYGNAKYGKTIVYEPSLKDIGTDLKYAQIGNTWGADKTIRYMAVFLRWKSIEILEKAGFTQLVESRTVGFGCKEINWKAKELKKILKAKDRGEIKELREFNPTTSELTWYRDLKKMGIDIPIKMIHTVSRYNERPLNNLKNHGIDLTKAVRYMYGQGGKLGDYADYIGDCIELGKDITDRHVARPKNFQEEHQRLAKLVQTKMNEEQEEEFQKHSLEISRMVEPFIEGEYMIRPAVSPFELEAESEALGHCVRTYIKKVVQGNCCILFVRTAEEPDKPMYTVEISPDRQLKQLRGYHNSLATDEVKNFVDRWIKQLQRTA